MSELIEAPLLETGELTVVVELGRVTEHDGRERPDTASLSLEIAEMTKGGAMSRRQALQQIAKKYGVKPNELYEELENAKKLVK